MKSVFHRLGVSSSVRLAGCCPTRCSVGNTDVLVRFEECGTGQVAEEGFQFWGDAGEWNEAGTPDAFMREGINRLTVELSASFSENVVGFDGVAFAVAYGTNIVVT